MRIYPELHDHRVRAGGRHGLFFTIFAVLGLWFMTLSVVAPEQNHRRGPRPMTFRLTPHA